MRIAARRWTLELRPERGGRITSLRLDGHELLDQGIGVDHPTADDFVEGGAWGWDEMVPTVERTGTLPDHGEAWRFPWRLDGYEETACSTSATGKALPWRLERTIKLTDSVRVDYVLSNTGDLAMPGYWCAHPLFRYERGMTIDAGAGLMSFAEGKSGKFFLPRGSIDHAELRWPGGPAIELRWDAERTPYCGVWICNGDLGGYRQVAIEPATGGGDRPDSDEPPPQLEPGRQMEWWMEIRAL